MTSPTKMAVFAAFLAVFSSLALFAGPPENAAWSSSVDEAVSAARAEQRDILVDLWADWCTWCKKLDENVFSTDVFESYAERFVLLRVDTEDGGEGTRLKERYEIDSLPTTLILTPDLVKAGELKGYLQAEPYIQSLELERAMFRLLVRAYSESVGDDSDPETIKMMADDFHSRRDGTRAAELYRQLLASDEIEPNESAWSRYLYADSLRLKGELDEAGKAQAAAHAAAADNGSPDLIELVDLLPYQIARDGERCGEAEAALVSFLAAHPEGQYTAEAETALDAIRRDEGCA